MIDLDVKDGVAWLRLNRPRSLNALDRSLTGALEDTLPRVAAMDDEDRDVVHRGHSRGRGLEGSRPGAVERVERPGAVEAGARRALFFVEGDRCNAHRGAGGP